MVCANEAAAYLVPFGFAGEEKFELGISGRVRFDVDGAQGGTRDVVSRLCRKAQDVRRGPARHRGNTGIVEVDHSGPAVRKGFKQLALGNGNIVHAAEFTGMGGSDAQDHSDGGPDHVREIADVADPGGAHLDHQVAGVEPGLENSERNTHFAVIGALG
ncbi:hypothetical protein D9M72_491440 [compost metagenome]